MKTKTINKVLCGEFDRFVASIKDERTRKLVKENSIITGGCIASMLLQEQVNDYDVYFTNYETTKAVADYYVNRFRDARSMSQECINVQVGADKFINYYQENIEADHEEQSAKDYIAKMQVYYPKDRVWCYVKSAGVAGDIPDGSAVGEALDSDGEDKPVDDGVKNTEQYEPIFLSQNAITLKGKFQLIIRFHGEPEEIHENYDFVHCTNYWTSRYRVVELKKQALECLLTKQLIYIGSKYPVCSIIRTRKFINRGYTVTAGEYLKMILQCNELDLFDMDCLEDQLTGVDSAFFSQAIHYFREKKMERLSSAYLSEIIDRIFQ